ncbi:imelysin family protein [Flavobacterium cerinum]|uniref:Imelysin family protein n=1 Tax=Flavobacterium cerinum TaxID=2502784 RepID=A0ABY5IRP5_9FLAO|nr:imelysin family protein [Flavobacterium cerinum]UUC45314.1 imelysin family protein [Flavobacterium cerinum]
MKKIGLLLTVVSQLVCSCDFDNSDSEVVVDKYDRKAILLNWADNNIMPSFQHYKTQLENLKSASDDFIATPDMMLLEEVRQKWLEAYKTYQYISMFTIGKADEIQLSKYSNTYPTATGQIEAKIDSGNFDLNGASFDVVQGFPALDYMLFGLGENEDAILERYTTNANADNYKGYLNALVNRLALLFNTVYDDWQSGFKATFIQKSDNTASGSVNRMVNAYIHFYEKDIRTAKIGYPAGKFSTETYPDKVEAYYSKKYSKELLLEAIIAAQNFFEGKHFNGNESGPSLKSYLDYLDIKGKSEESGILLSKLISNQFYKSHYIADLLLPDLSRQITIDNTKMTATFNALQRNVAYMKSDMTSAMSIAIDYADTDGD